MTQGELAEQYHYQQCHGDVRVRNELVKVGDVVMRRWQHEHFLMLMNQRDDYLREHLPHEFQFNFDDAADKYDDKLLKNQQNMNNF